MELLASGSSSSEKGFTALWTIKKNVADGDGEVVSALGTRENLAHVVFIGAEMQAAMFADEEDIEHVFPCLAIRASEV